MKKNAHQSLDVKEEHPDDAVVGLVDLVKIDQGIDRRCKRPIEPPTALADEFSRVFRDIRFSPARLDVGQCPPLAFLGDELETQDSVLS